MDIKGKTKAQLNGLKYYIKSYNGQQASLPPVKEGYSIDFVGLKRIEECMIIRGSKIYYDVPEDSIVINCT